MTSKTADVMGDVGRLTEWVEEMTAPEERPTSSWANNSSGNQLKLSIGCEDEDDSLPDDDMHDRFRAWSMHHSREPPIVHPITDVVFAHDEFLPSSLPDDFCAEVGQLIHENRPLFHPIPDGQGFVEEVWHVKPAKIVNGYLFGAIIGEGSYAKVKEVVEEQTLMRRAIKIFKDKRLRKIPSGLENVQREAKILRRLNHPNCIKMIEFFRVDEKCKQYMVLEYCVASLQEILELHDGNRLAEARAHFFFTQLIHGVDYMHSVGIVHKDIKPGNLLIAPDGTLKISDFGVAEKLDVYQVDDSCTVAQGTPKFQPPEVVSGVNPSFRGFAVDIWACGITLYNILSGEYPFEGEVIMRLFENIVKHPLSMPQSIVLDNNAEKLLMGMLEKEPEKRLTLHEVIEHEWFRSRFHCQHAPFDWGFLKETKNRLSHRPLTVYTALAQLFDNQEVAMETMTDGFPDRHMEAEPDEVPPRVPLVETPPPQRKKKGGFFSCFR